MHYSIHHPPASAIPTSVRAAFALVLIPTVPVWVAIPTFGVAGLGMGLEAQPNGCRTGFSALLDRRQLGLLGIGPHRRRDLHVGRSDQEIPDVGPGLFIA